MKSRSQLPHKICPICQRPFSWRKKWQRQWEEVRYCSKRCRGLKSSVKTKTAITSTKKTHIDEDRLTLVSE